FCDGIRRRDFVAYGVAGMGLSLPAFLQRSALGQVSPSARGKAAIFVQLAGGPSHIDTFDLKPDAPDTHRGEFRPIQTNVRGIQICEHLPKLAQCADKYAVLRGVSHTLAAHDLGTKYLNSGNRPLPSLEFPGYGAVVMKELSGDPDLPHFVAVPNTPQGGGYLGPAYGPLRTGTTPKIGQRFSIRGLDLEKGITLEDIGQRQNLLARFDTAFSDVEQRDQLVSGLNEFNERAYAMLTSDKARRAFDLSQESPSINLLFGDDNFSASCLLATRLVEAGVRFVTVSLGGWDTHADNFTQLKTKLLPQLDSGLAGLFNALSAKGLLDSTSVFVTGEFGRTPKINQRSAEGGRDHYPRAMFCLLAGGGMSGGQVIGESDETAGGPKSDAITPDDVAASFYQSLGIDITKEYDTPSGRPVMIVRHGKPLTQLWS
ncbi:MAG TPA: DUF1501 domain-containing protein, partial [Planctomycetaceae bacterium]|nr:DUF1501 domain-containing protein [Planctomycetaceae bacterium]